MGSAEQGLLLEGEIVRYSSVSLSPTLSKNEKVKRYIRKKTHKPIALRFWVEGGGIPLCGLAQFSLYEISPVMPLRIFPTSGIRVEGSCRCDGGRLIRYRL